MAWLRIDDGFPEHEKVLDLTDRAFRVHVVGLAQCAKNLTDGLVDHRRLLIVRAIVDKPITTAIKELVIAGLWSECEEGHQINDYLDYNPAAEKVKESRKRNAERQRTWRDSHNEPNGPRNDERNALPNAAPSRPRPSPTSTSKAVEVRGETASDQSVRNIIDLALKEAS